MDNRSVPLLTHQYLDAAKCGDLNTIQKLLPIMANSYSLLNATSSEGDTALILAVRDGHFDVVRSLIQSKVDLNIQTNFGLGYTALMYAIEVNNPLIVEALLLGNAKVDLKDCKGNSALSIDRNQMIKRFLEGSLQKKSERCSAVFWAFSYVASGLPTHFLPASKTVPENQQPLLPKPINTSNSTK